MQDRAGTYVKQPSGYNSFLPKKLPPNPPIEYDVEMSKLLSDADRKLGRLDGVAGVLPNTEMFIAMYVRKEAVLSSQIEGTQASLTDILDIEVDANKKVDIDEIINYVKAMNYGLDRLKDFPLSLRLIREIHEKLLGTGRGSRCNPGEFRQSQNWIGPAGSTLKNATFIPPAVSDMLTTLYDLENFMAKEDELPVLIKIGIIHAQFETIHPFLDGNGRVGRLLITFWLCAKEILSEPLLYLSYYFKENRIEYYDRLTAVRKKGDWEGWIKFFLKGIAYVADEATTSAKDIVALKDKYIAVLHQYSNSNYLKLLDALFTSSIITKKSVAEILGVSYPTAHSVVDEFVELGILVDATPERKRNKKFWFGKYLAILERGTKI